MILRPLLCLPLLLFVGVLHALEKLPYDEAAFARTQTEGKVSVLLFHTAWCPVCIMQERSLESLKGEKAYEQVRVFVADFLRERALREKHNVGSFATLVVFRGNEEKARVTGESRVEQIRSLLGRAL